MQLLDLRGGVPGADADAQPDSVDALFRDRHTSGSMCACLMTLLEDHSDLSVTWSTLRLVDELMSRLPQVYRELFVRQGNGSEA